MVAGSEIVEVPPDKHADEPRISERAERLRYERRSCW
jgi:hypothetical protein